MVNAVARFFPRTTSCFRVYRLAGACVIRQLFFFLLPTTHVTHTHVSRGASSDRSPAPVTVILRPVIRVPSSHGLASRGAPGVQAVPHLTGRTEAVQQQQHGLTVTPLLDTPLRTHQREPPLRHQRTGSRLTPCWKFERRYAGLPSDSSPNDSVRRAKARFLSG